MTYATASIFAHASFALELAVARAGSWEDENCRQIWMRH